MKTMAASDARKSFARVLDDAAREPVVIRRRGRDVAVVLSMQDYERLVHLKNKAEFQRLCDRIGQRTAAAGMNDERLAELLHDDDKRG